MVLKLKQRVFIAECYAKHNSCAELFAQTSSKVCNAKFSGKMAQLKRETIRKRVRTPENIAQVKESLEKSPKKSKR
ncbi:hypothetical protein NPIL_658291 [Nephila pilipes]|uniref:Uncharacterized protein n=1 Tax=Nephila pilipes TaxID=299642 RepID=A0A8X6P1T2_NEPPI|nr:hypothetical protein NPIL_658291 [Nephila pilipes]